MKQVFPTARIAKGACRLFSAFKEAVFPDICLVCGTLYSRNPIDGVITDDGWVADAVMGDTAVESLFSRLLRPYVCPTCLSGFIAFASPMCPCCGMAFKSREGVDHLCQNCIEMPVAYHMARSLGAYGASMMAVIHAFKYQRCIQLARPLAALLLQVFLTYWQDRPVDIVVPVPLHPKKMKQRGFNQSLLLVRHWERLLRRIDFNGFRPVIDATSLVRLRRTQAQTGLGRRQRIGNIRGAFGLSPATSLEGKTVLLVDDVYTTGATVGECAKLLRKGGAERIDVLTLARTV